MSLASKYRREIQSWNWDAIIKEAKANPSETMDGDTVGMCYLGSLINPSGKYYLPFACSNVEPCPTCKGEGTTKNRHADSLQYALFVQEASKLRTEVMAQYGYWANGQWPKETADRITALDKAADKVKETRTCQTCQGVGSLEAYRDEVWNEVLEVVASEHGGSVEAGEGDPCDTFFVIALETEETANA